MTIGEKLKTLNPFFKGIRIVEGLELIEMTLKKGWVIPKSEIISSELLKAETNAYMFYPTGENVTIDDLIDFAKMVIDLNTERELKRDLFKEKVEELKEVFKANDLNKLKDLSFEFTSVERIEEKEDDEFTYDEEINIPLSESKIINVEQPVKEPEIKEFKETFIPEETTSVVHNNVNIELPPRNSEGKVVLDNFNEVESVCNCKDGEACEKCITM